MNFCRFFLEDLVEATQIYKCSDTLFCVAFCLVDNGGEMIPKKTLNKEWCSSDTL